MSTNVNKRHVANGDAHVTKESQNGSASHHGDVMNGSASNGTSHVTNGQNGACAVNGKSHVSEPAAERLRNEKVNISPGIPGFGIAMLGILMLLWPIAFVWSFWLACNSYKCSLSTLGGEFLAQIKGGTFLAFIWNSTPEVTASGLKIFLIWLVLQVVLYVFLPGRKATGVPTPAGNTLVYKCNGFNAWLLTHALYIGLARFGFMKMTIIYDHWGSILVLANTLGMLLTVFVYLKAHYFPTHKEDRCFSGSFFYDFYMGIEANPRIGDFDFKLFFNGRPGIVAWTLINLSFAAKQYEVLGHVTNSMVLVNVLQGLYVVDFFIHEAWYLRTIDIAHDHFGFYLAWGDTVFLPFMYTLQAAYLVQNPVHLSWFSAFLILILGISGYFIFRSVNSQKDYFRSTMKRTGECEIWGKPAVYIPAEYTTSDGEVKQSWLLASGWWGVSRHFNYCGDLMNSLSYCIACGFAHVLPYFYLAFMSILLVHRSFRDDVRCREKYGPYWELYTKVVPYRIIPYIF